MAKLLAIGALLVTVFITTGSVTDPVNETKLLMLGAVGCGALVLFIARGFKQGMEASKVAILATCSFIVFSLFAVISSNLPVTQNFYGVFGRNTGFVTYLLLAGVLLGATTLSDLKSFRWLTYSLLSAGIVNILYCGWVIAFGDFVAWNNPYGNILGLFGNPNFIGAFLGIWVSAASAFLLAPALENWKRFLLALLILLALYEVYKSHAVQGVVVTSAGVATVVFFFIRSRTKSSIPVTIYSSGVLFFGVLALLGALQKGPLAQIVYKTSVSLRGSYWNAGIQMGLQHPFTGVGMDGYGDWYRRTRSIHAATVMPGPNTVTNSAHNVVIDIFSYGGFPLLLSYLTLLALGAISIIRGLRRSKQYDVVFVALTVAWLGYQLQSLISINQIGLAVWGWVLTGALIAYQKFSEVSNSTSQAEVNKSKKSVVRGSKNEVISSPLLAGLGAVIGLILACPPMSGDIAWVKAMRASSLVEVENALMPSYLHPRSSYQLINAVGILENNKLFDQAHKYALEATEFNPDSFDSWVTLYSVSKASDSEKALALKNMKRLDPHNPDVTKR